jgi:ATP-binding cassette, subfamily A (ABC1), member 3
MSEGRLRCCGSSLFLKKTYGVGYQLTIEKLNSGKSGNRYLLASSAHGSGSNGDKARDDEPEVACEVESIDDILRDIVKHAVTEASLLSNVGSAMTYQLPLGAASKFTPMFEGLDAEIERGNVSSYGVSITTLDEVFLMVARGQTEGHATSASSGNAGSVNIADDGGKSTRSRINLEKDNLFMTHLVALYKKRAANFSRDKKAWVCTTILPSVFVLIGLLVFTFASPTRDLGSITLTLDAYNADVSVTPRNPIAYNNPGSFYSCQPGSCAYKIPIVDRPEANERYFYCGFQAELPPLENCSISDSSLIAGRLDGFDGAKAEGTDASDVFQVSAERGAGETLPDG